MAWTVLERAVAQRFAEEERAAVMALLAQHGGEPYEREVDVQMSNGSLPRLASTARTTTARSAFKIWLERVVLARNGEFSSREVRRIREMIFEHRPRILEAWNAHCRRAQYQTQDCIRCSD